MDNLPFFSIVIPTYNRRHLLPKTLDTVFDQTFKDFELIVIDNGSTDNTQELICSRYAHKRLRYFRYEINRERSWARNIGFSKSLGLYSTLLDSDDFLYPTALKDAYTYALENPDTKIFHNLYELVDEQFKTIYRYYFPSLRNQHKAIASGNFLSCIGVYLHRNIYKCYTFDTDPLMIGSEDYELWLRILSEYKLGRISKVNSGIRHHNERSVNKSAYISLDYQSRKILNLITSVPDLQNCYHDHMMRLKASFYMMRANTCIINRHILRSCCLLSQAVKCEPTVLTTVRPYQTFYNILKAQFRFML